MKELAVVSTTINVLKDLSKTSLWMNTSGLFVSCFLFVCHNKDVFSYNIILKKLLISLLFHVLQFFSLIFSFAFLRLERLLL